MSFIKSLKHILAPHTSYSDTKKDQSDNKVKIAEMQNAKEMNLAKMELEQAERDRKRSEEEARAERLAYYNASLEDLERGN